MYCYDCEREAGECHPSHDFIFLNTAKLYRSGLQKHDIQIKSTTGKKLKEGSAPINHLITLSKKAGLFVQKDSNDVIMWNLVMNGIY